MNNKIIIPILVNMLMFISIFGSAVNVKINNNPTCNLITNKSVEKPDWEEGDSWTYSIDVNGGYESSMNFDMHITNMKFEVEQVLSDKYKLTVSVPSGNVQGHVDVSGDILTLSGDLTGTSMSGTYYVNKEDLSYRSSNLVLEGAIDKVIDIHFSTNMDITFFPFYRNLEFPIDVGNTWVVDETGTTIEYDVTVGSLLTLNDQYAYFYTEPNEFKVISQGSEPDSGYTDAFKIQDIGTSNYFWFSELAGNIVKVDYEDVILWIYKDETEEYFYRIDSLDIILIDTSYELPNELPNSPDKPTGPSSGRVGISYSFCASGGDDPDENQIRYGFDWNGDNSVDSWTEFVNSGEQACVDKTFTSPGKYNIKAKTQDSRGGESGWSAEKSVDIVENQPPNIPDIPSGETNGMVGISYTYSTDEVTDPDGDTPIEYIFDWGDGSNSGWGTSTSAAHVFSSKGTFEIKVKARDTYGAESAWSESLIVFMDNNAPITPEAPIGPSSAREDTTVTFTVVTTDPDGHEIFYKFDWGDGSSSQWEGPYDSGIVASITHKWTNEGNFAVKVKAKDEWGLETDWSPTTPISIPRGKNINYNIFKLLENLRDILPKLLIKIILIAN